MTDQRVTVARLAKALYETDTGSDGYPPTHTHMSWRDYCACGPPNLHKERAEAMLRLLDLKDDS